MRRLIDYQQVALLAICSLGFVGFTIFAALTTGVAQFWGVVFALVMAFMLFLVIVWK